MNNKIVCIASFTAKAGMENELMGALHALVHPSRAEPGCVSYELFRGKEQPGLFTVVEVFESDAAWAAHGEQPYLVAFKKALGELVESVSVNLHEPA